MSEQRWKILAWALTVAFFGLGLGVPYSRGQLTLQEMFYVIAGTALFGVLLVALTKIPQRFWRVAGRVLAFLLLPVTYPVSVAVRFFSWITAPLRRWQPKNRYVRWVWGNKLATVCLLVIVGLFILPGILAEQIAPYEYQAQDLRNTLALPSAEHWLGTDRNGRDLLTRVLYSDRTLLGVAAATVIVGSMIFPPAIGIYSGYKRGKVDVIVSRAGEFVNMLPGMLMMILISMTIRPGYEAFMKNFLATPAMQWFAGSGTRFFLVLAFVACIGLFLTRKKKTLLVRKLAWTLLGTALGAISGAWLVSIDGFADFLLIFVIFLPFAWYGGARLIRSVVLRLRRLEFVLYAEAIGASTWWVMTRHLLPNVLGYIVMGIAGTMAAVAGSELALTFLGFGIQAPTPSYGSLIQDGADLRVLTEAPHLFLVPAILVVVYIFAWVLLGYKITQLVTLRQKNT